MPYNNRLHRRLNPWKLNPDLYTFDGYIFIWAYNIKSNHTKIIKIVCYFEELRKPDLYTVQSP